MKTVLITGASRGIGAATARVFAANGCHTVITCSGSEDSLLSLKEELEGSYHVPCTAVVCDAGDYPSVERLFASIPAPDVLINNAGVSYFGLLSEMPVEDWQKVMNTNLNACFYTCKLAIPSMVHKKEGRIINISSVWGNAGSSLETAYSASKGGINAFTKALAKELAPSNIQVNAIAPGLIDTAMNHCLSQEDIHALKEEIPADRIGTPEEVAALIWQVVTSPTYMTGQVISIDGGWI
ncbi:MAG: elongation factor P 5-aminopentanone reductase [Lachnospiraceae bacterium]